MPRQNVDTVENVVRAMIQSTSLSEFFIGVHNAIAHGDAIKKNAGMNIFSDEELGKLIGGIETCIQVSKEIESDNDL